MDRWLRGGVQLLDDDALLLDDRPTHGELEHLWRLLADDVEHSARLELDLLGELVAGHSTTSSPSSSSSSTSSTLPAGGGTNTVGSGGQLATIADVIAASVMTSTS